MVSDCLASITKVSGIDIVTDLEFMIDETNSFHQRAVWVRQFAWWPHWFELTDRFIWLLCAYCGRAVWSGPGDDAVEVRWHDSREHLFWTLKGPHR